MIIISQDEETIVNFDNVKALRTAFYSDCVGIKAVLGEEYGVLLGLYKDATRAKEVLKALMQIYPLNNNGVFTMPKE